MMTTGSDSPADKRTVQQRMEALGWRFDVDPDACVMEPMKVSEAGTVRAYGNDDEFQEDYARCFAEAERDGALVHY
jgi:hypothetical protein